MISTTSSCLPARPLTIEATCSFVSRPATLQMISRVSEVKTVWSKYMSTSVLSTLQLLVISSTAGFGTSLTLIPYLLSCTKKSSGRRFTILAMPSGPTISTSPIRPLIRLTSFSPLVPAMVLMSVSERLMKCVRSPSMSSLETMPLTTLRRAVTGLMRLLITASTPLFARKNDALPSTSRIVEIGLFSMSSTRPKIPSKTSSSIALASAKSSQFVVVSSMPRAFASGMIALS